MTQVTSEELTRLKALCDVATSGPWNWRQFIFQAKIAMPLLIAEVERLQENERSDLLNSKIRRQEIERLRSALEEIAKQRSRFAMDAPAIAREALK